MIDESKLLAGVPPGLRDPLLKSYREIAANYLERRWEPSELNGGKFCEIVHSIVAGALQGRFPAAPSKPASIVDACRALEGSPAVAGRPGDRSLRILIPRMLPPLYEIRNNRGVGHVGGDVDPNFLDATAVHSMTSWLLAELVRIFHGVSTKDAQEAVDALVERKHPLIWEFENTRRVLAPKMKKAQQVLLLLHAKPGWVSETDMIAWVEHSNATVFRGNILRNLHRSRLIEFDESQHRMRISPSGVRELEEKILKTRTK
jgi:hypothetical protein